MSIRAIPKEAFGDHTIDSLLHIPDPPETLWVSGTLPGAHIKKLAVVGSRAMTPYSKEVCSLLIQGLRGYPVSIVSGLALGLDAEAHKAALNAGLHTIAIPGSGLDTKVIAPRSNALLAQQIVEQGGALLSEHPPQSPSRQHFFPSRNRLMAGIADAVLMLEAREESGTLITARLAAEYGRELLCIPHRIGDPGGYGAELFIRLGATLVSTPAHILEALQIPLGETPQTALPLLSTQEAQIYEALLEPKEKDALLRSVALPVGEALSALISLELQGLIEERFGKLRRVIHS